MSELTNYVERVAAELVTLERLAIVLDDVEDEIQEVIEEGGGEVAANVERLRKPNSRQKTALTAVHPRPDQRDD